MWYWSWYLSNPCIYSFPFSTSADHPCCVCLSLQDFCWRCWVSFHLPLFLVILYCNQIWIADRGISADFHIQQYWTNLKDFFFNKQIVWAIKVRTILHLFLYKKHLEINLPFKILLVKQITLSKKNFNGHLFAFI